MHTLKLIKSLSYTGVVSATKEHPIVCVEDEATAQKAVASGYFELISEEPAAGDTENEPENTIPDKTFEESLEELNKSELETLATYHGIALTGLKTKSDYIGAIVASTADKTEAERLDMLNYGSPTMTELQSE